MEKCQIYQEPLHILQDFGPQPVCNRYLREPDAKEYRHPLILAQCKRDGLLQLAKPWPSDEVRPRFDWITYKEPEAHLDDMAERIARLPGIGEESLVVGLSYKDEPVLERLANKGFRNLWNIPIQEFGITAPGAGMESIQDALHPDIVRKLVLSRGAPCVIVVRHLLEHSNSVSNVLKCLSLWGDKHSYFVFEVPDSEQTFKDCDYGTLWEEHVCYFTEHTLSKAFSPFELDLIELTRYPYTLEDCLVAFVANRKPRVPVAPSSPEQLLAQARLGQEFVAELPKMRRRCHAELEALSCRGGKIALLGAGHRAITFINLLELGDYLDFIVDDDPRKEGLFLPGSHLPILKSTALLDTKPAICLLAASPDSECKIRERNESYLAEGGEMPSIYPRSQYAWQPLISGR